MIRNHITESYENTTPMTRKESQTRHQESRQESRKFRLPRLLTVASVAGGLLLAHFTYERAVDTTPACNGEQTIEVHAGDTIRKLEAKHITATDGHIDFRSVEVSVERPVMFGNGNSAMRHLGDVAEIIPGDRVTMPLTCEG